MTAWLVIAIVAGVVVLIAIVLLRVRTFVRRRGRLLDQRVARDLAGVPALRGPEGRAVYMGGTGGYPRTSSNGKLALTSTHVTFWSVVGTDVALALDEILEVDTTTDGSRSRPVPNRPHLRVLTGAGKVVIDVRDGEEWADAVRAQLRTDGDRDER